MAYEGHKTCTDWAVRNVVSWMPLPVDVWWFGTKKQVRVCTSKGSCFGLAWGKHHGVTILALPCHALPCIALRVAQFLVLLCTNTCSSSIALAVGGDFPLASPRECVPIIFEPVRRTNAQSITAYVTQTSSGALWLLLLCHRRHA